MINLPLGFLLGFLGSLHCAVMCGPLMLSFPLARQNKISTLFQLVAYQFGRTLTYVLFGFLVGSIGSVITIFTNQETLSFLIGCILIIFTIIHFFSRTNQLIDRLSTKLVSPISKLMGKVCGSRYWGIYAGMLNGLIPCGMVYLALASALNTASVGGAGMFMFQFGLGTTPLMLVISLGGIYLKNYLRLNTKRLMPWLMLFLGALFILRSAELDIPFLSPSTSLHHGKVVECR